MKAKILIVILFLQIFSVAPVSAQTMFEESSTSATVVVTPAPKDYVFPYPGMLPDNPLYFFKATRDRIISMLISDVVKKADFHLLQADKSLQTGLQFVAKNKKPQAIESFQQAEKYFAVAVTEVQNAQKQKKDVNALLGRIAQSGARHQELLIDTMKNFSGQDKKTLQSLQEKMRKHTDKATSLLPK